MPVPKAWTSPRSSRKMPSPSTFSLPISLQTLCLRTGNLCPSWDFSNSAYSGFTSLSFSDCPFFISVISLGAKSFGYVLLNTLGPFKLKTARAQNPRNNTGNRIRRIFLPMSFVFFFTFSTSPFRSLKGRRQRRFFRFYSAGLHWSRARKKSPAYPPRLRFFSTVFQSRP